MADDFQFSPRPNRAAEIRWRPWGPAVFEEAEKSDRPIFLALTASWCQWCHRMDEETYSDPAVIALLNDGFLPLRVDADRMPHVRDRYIAGGWPTTAFLTPDGEVLWSGTSVGPQRLVAVSEQVQEAWRLRREPLLEEIERRRKALAAARSRRGTHGLVRREAADDVMSVAQDSFDPRNGGFGDEPKFPPGEAVELLYLQGVRSGNPDWMEMADRTLDGILAGELWDDVEGGFFRYALQADWTEPRHEKLLATNAELLQAYALGARVRGRVDWAGIAERTVAWVEANLALPDGLWASSQAADPSYYELDADGRSGRPRPGIDRVILTDANAAWIRALAHAGGSLGREDWVERAALGLETLQQTMAAEGGLLHHFRPPEAPPRLVGLATDVLETGLAAAALAQATGEARFVDHARASVRALETSFWRGDGGVVDHVSEQAALGALRYEDRPFDINAGSARLLIDLNLATGERKYRGMAERILAFLSPLAGRYGVAAAGFAAAVEEFFQPPVQVFLVGDPESTAPLRRAALRSERPERRAWTLSEGGNVGTVTLDRRPAPAAYVCGGHSRSAPLTDPEAVTEALRAVD